MCINVAVIRYWGVITIGDYIPSHWTNYQTISTKTHLLKRLQFREDYFGEHCQLHYIRDRDGREVDFVTVVDKKIIDLIEVKLSDDEPSTALKYYRDKLKPQNTVQIVGDLKRSFDVKGIRVTNPIDYFQQPPWDTRSV